MTIFLLALKKLIKEQLNTLSASLAVKAKRYGYNNKLSQDQKEIIDELLENIVLFQGHGNDESDTKAIVILIQKSFEKVQATRENHEEPKDGGDTIACLNNLRNHSTGFYTKLSQYKFNLLNKPYYETPENIVYYHAAYYFGDEIFIPNVRIDVVIRTAKEEKLVIRLQSLLELIKPDYNLEDRRSRTLQVLKDLAADNRLATQKNGKPMALPGLSLWGVQLTAPNQWFEAGEGRFGEQFNSAVRKITAMKAEDFKMPPAGKAIPAAAAPPPPPVSHQSDEEEEKAENSIPAP